MARFIPTRQKAGYINTLLKVGFDTIDVGSFVSARAMPQVSDTAGLLSMLDRRGTSTRLLTIVANERGAEEACRHPEVDYLGFPFSVSETFQQRNTNASMTVAAERVRQILTMAMSHRKALVLYISMGFGNPYGDAWSVVLVEKWVNRMAALGISVFSLADTVGMAEVKDIQNIFTHFTRHYPQLEFGAHFHARPDNWRDKIQAAYDAGCRRFDGALLGYGGCPMAQDRLVGNIATENLIAFARDQSLAPVLHTDALKKARELFSAIVQGDP